MTGFAQVKGEVQRSDRTGEPPVSPMGGWASLSLKSVNHRFLDLHFRLPSGTDSLEMQLRRLLKEKLARGHVEISLSLERGSSEASRSNRELVGGYIAAFRAAAAEFSLAAEPDLNTVLRIPGRSTRPAEPPMEKSKPQSWRKLAKLLDRLNQMREEEGRGIARELRDRMAHLAEASKSVQQHRRAVLQNYSERLQSRLQELFGSKYRQGTHPARSRSARRSQRHSGRDRPPGNPRPALPGLARRRAERSARSWISCCRK